MTATTKLTLLVISSTQLLLPSGKKLFDKKVLGTMPGAGPKLRRKVSNARLV